MNVRRGPQLGLALLIALSGCERTPEGTERAATSPSAPSEPTTSPTVQNITPTGAFFLDLRTGEQTPLPSTGAKDFGAAVDDGHYYAASPDGSTIYWEDTCCLAADVAATASIDGSHGRRLDPPGPINYYAGGWSPDGTKIVYQRRDPRGPLDGAGARFFGDLVVEDIESGRKTTVELGLGPAVVGFFYLAPTFSSDGRNLIFNLPRESSSGPKSDLWSVPVAGGERTLLVRNAAQPATSYDGDSYAFARPLPDGDGSSLMIATPEGFRTLVDRVFGLFEPKMSPDGTRIAYGDEEGSIHVVDVATGESTEVAVGRMAAWVDNDTLIVAPKT